MAVKLTFEAESETELLDVIRAVALNEREQGLILDQQIARLDADAARRKPKTTRWNLYYYSPVKAVTFLAGYSDEETAQKALKHEQEYCLPDWEPQYFYLKDYTL